MSETLCASAAQIDESPGGPAACQLSQDQLAKLIQFRESLETEQLFKQNPDPPAKNWDMLCALYIDAFEPIIRKESRRNVKPAEWPEAAEHAKGACFEAFKKVGSDSDNIAGYTRKVIQNELKEWRLLRGVWNMSPQTAYRRLRGDENYRFARVQAVGDRLFGEEIIDEVRSRFVATGRKPHAVPRRDALELEDLLVLFPDSDVDRRIVKLCWDLQIQGEPYQRYNWLITNELNNAGFKVSEDSVRRYRRRIGETIERRFPDRFRRTERYKRQLAAEEAAENPPIVAETDAP